MNKPFKPLTLKRPGQTYATPSQQRSESVVERIPSTPPPAKKHKVIHINDTLEKNEASTTILSLSASAPSRKPLVEVNKTVTSQPFKSIGSEGYYAVLWRNKTNKKHKTWDGDGILSVRNGYASLQDISGRDMGKTSFADPLFPGSSLSIGSKDIEIDVPISKTDYMAGKPFLKGELKTIVPPIERFELKKPSNSKKVIDLSSPTRPVPFNTISVTPRSFYAPLPTVSTRIWKSPVLNTTVMPKKKDGSATPRHDPEAVGALVFQRPRSCPRGKEIVDVVLDPCLTEHIREHQRIGVQFLYECVMGFREFDGQGALLADAMGLGKTFMTIALIWTLLKQNPIHGSDSIIRKAVIVCPVTLIQNWRKEFKRWLGKERIGVYVADGNKMRPRDFTHSKSYSVMIIGYEKLRNVQDELARCDEIDLVVCDEGHRLKTDGNKSAQAIKALSTSRRIILSGTPLQNDLGELFVMVDFINPGVLGTYKTFKKEFEIPIMASRNPEATSRQIEKGEARQEELSDLTKQFVLRREADVLNKYLLPKTEYVLFCRPTQGQIEVYQHVLASPVFGALLGSSDASLQLITMLKKVCNSPTLLSKRLKDEETSGAMLDLIQSMPSHLLSASSVKVSTKMRVLDAMIKHISQDTKEKIVLVSNYTSTLDMLAQHLNSLGLTHARLDGKTPTSKRQDIVDSFNKNSAIKCFAFLLSAKSGGAGINLIGASRLVLFDVDWNPATDLQAMARIHRDGQRRPVKIYRFLMAGGMDEKIYQRQVTKMGLSESVIDGKKSESSFSQADLRDLFRLDVQTACQTHELLCCDCEGRGISPPPASALSVSDSESATPDSRSIISNDDSSCDDDLPLVPRVHDFGGYSDMKKERKKKSKGKMQSLMQYTHVDTSIFAEGTKDIFDMEVDEINRAKEALTDDVLSRMLDGNTCKVNYVFVKKG